MARYVDLVRSALAVPQPAPAARAVPTGQVPRRHAIGPAGLHRSLCGAGVFALLAVLAAQVLSPDLLQRASAGLAVVGILIGIPHGAVDHMIPFWTSGIRPRPGRLAAVVARYLLVAGLAAVSLWLAPDLGVTAFLLASIVHFGQAEVQFDASTRPQRSSVQWDLLEVLAHGGAVVVLPLALWHSQVARVIGPVAPWFASDHSMVFVPLAIGVVALNGVLALLMLQQGRVGDAGQIALVVVVFVVVPPLAAFAAYFGFWHALRHTGRLLALPGPSGASLPFGDAMRRYVLHAAVPTVAVACALPIVWRYQSQSLITGALVVVLALTFPHMRTVAALDRWAARHPRDAAQPRRVSTPLR